MTNSILFQTHKPELAQYLHEALFNPTSESLLQSIKQGFLKTWPGLTEKNTKKHIGKSRKTTMESLQMIRLGIQTTRDKLPDTDMEDESKTNVIFF